MSPEQRVGHWYESYTYYKVIGSLQLNLFHAPVLHSGIPLVCHTLTLTSVTGAKGGALV